MSAFLPFASSRWSTVIQVYETIVVQFRMDVLKLCHFCSYSHAMDGTVLAVPLSGLTRPVFVL